MVIVLFYPVNVFVKKFCREFGIAGGFCQVGLQIGDGIGFHYLTTIQPNGAHIVVECEVKLTSQPQIEGQGRCPAIRIITCKNIVFVSWVVKNARVGINSEPAHLCLGVFCSAWRIQHAVHKPRQGAGVLLRRVKARTHQQQFAVILGKTLGKPKLTAHVGVRKVKRLEGFRPDALDVPAVEIFMRKGAEQTHLVSFHLVNRLYDAGRVAMLHAIAGNGGVNVIQKGVLAEVVSWQFTVHRFFLKHHFRYHLAEVVDDSLRVVGMNC